MHKLWKSNGAKSVDLGAIVLLVDGKNSKYLSEVNWPTKIMRPNI